MLTNLLPRVWFIHLQMTNFQSDEAIVCVNETILFNSRTFNCNGVQAVRTAAEQFAKELGVPLCWTFIDEEIYADKVGAGSTSDLYEIPDTDEYLYWLGQKIGYEEIISTSRGYSPPTGADDELEEEEEEDIYVSLEEISTTELVEEIEVRREVLYLSVLTEDMIVLALEEHHYAASEKNVATVQHRVRELMGANHKIACDMLAAVITGSSQGVLDRDEPSPVIKLSPLQRFFRRAS